MPKRRLDRAAIARLAQGIPQTIAALEQIFGDVDGTLPSTIEEANALAGQALAVAQGTLVVLAALTEAMEAMETAPAALPQEELDDTAPRMYLGTIASQNADEVEITGGTAALTSITITSTDKVDNLYADRAAVADALGAPTTLPAAATDLPTAIELLNALRAAAIEKGL